MADTGTQDDSKMDAGSILGGVAGTLLGGPIGGAAASGLFNLVSGMFSNRDKNGLNKDTPQYQDPYAMQRRVVADQMLNSKLGNEYAASESGKHARRADDMYERLDRDFSGNAAVSSSLYNDVHNQAENEDVSSNIQGAQMNEQSRKQGLSELDQLSGENSANWHDYVTRASKPTMIDTVLGNAYARTTGNIVGASGRAGTDLILKGLGFGNDDTRGGTGGGTGSGGGSGGGSVMGVLDDEG